MLMIENEPKIPVVGNFYFSPVRFRPVFEPAYEPVKYPKSRLKHAASLKPKSRHGSLKIKEEEVDVNSELTEDKSPIDEAESDEESDTVRPEPKKENHKKKKNNNAKSKKESKSSKKENTLEHLCSKLRVSFVLSLLGVIILLACCCALFLRNRIVACLKKCCGRKKNKSKKNLFDVEQGYPYQSSRFSPFGKSKKKKSAKLVDTGTQDSRTVLAKPQEESPKKVGCSPCCKKKKKKKSSKKRGK